MTFHGSDIEKIARQFGVQQNAILNFSANISPLGVPESVRGAIAGQADCISRYPDREYVSLRTSIANYCGAQASDILVGNGASELITLMIKTVRPRHVLIAGPCYSEYEHAVEQQGGVASYYFLREEDEFAMDIDRLLPGLNRSLDMLILCNPNNPTSTVIRGSGMEAILHKCRENGIRVMVDETYVEFADEPEAISSVRFTGDYKNLAVIRGTSKFFAAPGLRLGYLITGDQDLLCSLRLVQEPWNVSAIADVAGRAMFSDSEYIAKAQAFMRNERKRVYRELLTFKRIRVFAPEANFVLIELLPGAPDAETVFRACLDEGLLIRNCSSFPTLEERYIRFCFMSSEDNDRLLARLRSVIEEAIR